jgi:CHAT domain-containing protein/tetratricopeptide (TPR) repeat protein
MDAKAEALLDISKILAKVGGLSSQADGVVISGNYGDAARTVYNEYIAKLRLYLQTALDFNQQFPDSPWEIHPIADMLVNALTIYADIEQSLGDRTTAEALHNRALEVSLIHLDSKETANLERRRAGTLTMEGRFNEAIVALMNARDLFQEEDDLLDLLRVTIDLANILQWLGDNRRAKEEIDKVEKIIQPMLAGRQLGLSDVSDATKSAFDDIMAGHGNSGEAALQTTALWRAALEVTYYRGLTAKALKKCDEAEGYFDRILPESKKLGSGEAILFQLAQIKIERRQFREALEQIQQIEHVFNRGDYRPKLGVFRYTQAKCLLALREPEDALQLVEEAIADLIENHFDPDTLWKCHWLKAQIYTDRGEQKLSLDSLQSALEIVNNLRRAPLGYRLDSTYMGEKKEFYSYAIEETIKANAPLDCCRFIESIKSRTLSAVLSIPTADNGVCGELEEQFDEVTQQLDVMEYQAYQQEWNQQRKLQHQELLKKRSDLLERIRISDPRWRNLSQPIELKFEELLASLSKRSQAAITLYYEPPNLSAVLLFDGKATAEQLEISEEIANNLVDYAKNLQHLQAVPDYNKYDLSAEYSVLAEHLIPPSLLSQALTANSLVVIPYGLLHLVPWGGLMHEGRRLFEYLPVGILPNLNSLTLGEESCQPNRVALVGVSSYSEKMKDKDLPSVSGEIEEIEFIYAAANVVVTPPLLDDKATEQEFWNLMGSIQGDGNVLHIACHGTLEAKEPMNSGLLLYDSKVDAAEVARARLAFDEAVLSACSTGWRPFKVDSLALVKVDSLTLDADEILGIPAGFLESGVNSVLVSIPKADDTTARTLTTHYHRQRIAGNSPLVAFQNAQKFLLGQGEPLGKWIGFTLYSCI